MLELGDASEKQHAEVGIKCSSLKIDMVFTIGEQTVFTNSNINDQIFHKHFDSRKLLIQTLKEIIKKNDTVLFKGSRSMEMDKIIERDFNF